MADRARTEAGHLPGPEQIRDIGERAAQQGGKRMSRQQIRDLTGEAVRQSERLAFLMRELSTLIDGEPGGAHGQSR